MKIKIKTNNELVDATIEIVDGVMIVSPKKVKEVDITQFKDGDIIFCGWDIGYKSYNWISILRGEIKRIADNLFIGDYCTLNCDGTFSLENGDSDSATYVRYATEEEKKQLFNKLDQEGYVWDEGKKAITRKKWTPKMDEGYWSIQFSTRTVTQESFSPAEAMWQNDNIDQARLINGYVFRTKAESQEFCNKLNQAFAQIKI